MSCSEMFCHAVYEFFALQLYGFIFDLHPFWEEMRIHC